MDKNKYTELFGNNNLSIKERIDFLEKNNMFDIDPGVDPDTIELLANKVDYLNRKLSSKINTKIANIVAKNHILNLIKNKKLIIKEFIGMENLNNLDGGFIITCNHFNPFDNFIIHKMVWESKHKKTLIHKVIREGNYTNFKGLYGYFFKHCNTLPLSSNKHTMINFMNAFKTIINNKGIILIYPEQSLWLDYKKPKPLKNGAFKLAYKNNAPILPVFITFNDSDLKNENGDFIQEYSVHILPPIYKDDNLSQQENIEMMKNKNYNYWKEIYEKTYNEKLVYLS